MATIATLALCLALIPASAALASGKALYHKHVCGPPKGHTASCTAEVRTKGPGGAPLATSSYQSGYKPSDLQSAYAAATAAASNGGNQTVAIVDAYDAPNAASDLNVYRQQFNLPLCGTGCFTKVNQNGGSTPPTADGGWAQEISLDLDMVSAICPNCHILLVEANSASYSDLATAVDEAVALGATQVSNSYGGSESYGTPYAADYAHTGVAITASSGDNGYGIEFPASAPTVTAVGGTSLSKASNSRGWSETVWSGAGSGCSGYFSKPTWQKDSGCSKRTVADVSAVADPNTGVSVYDSYSYQGSAGWMVFGGTSVASPIVAAVNAITGGGSGGMASPGYAYAHTGQFNDVTSGSNGNCGGSYLCTGTVGYDGPTGIGTPNVALFGGGTTTAPPSNTTPPSISGTTTQGQTLTADPGAWSGSPTYAYQWQSCLGTTCANVGGNSASYTLQASDVNKMIQVIVTASNSGGSSSATSQAVGPVAGIPDFTISVSPSSQSVRRGQGTSYQVSVSPTGGFTSLVGLQISGLPSGATASFTPSSLYSGTSTLAVNTSSSGPWGTYTLTITGTGGTVTHSATASLTVRRK